MIIDNQNDMLNELTKLNKKLSEVRRSNFDLQPVTEYSAIKSISFNIEQEEQLKRIGALSKCPKWTYGYFRSNENNGKVNNELYAATKMINEIQAQLKNNYLTPKRELTEKERNSFKLIKGGDNGSWVITQLESGLNGEEIQSVGILSRAALEILGAFRLSQSEKQHLAEFMLEDLTYEKTLDLLLDIKNNFEDFEGENELDRILWCTRIAYITGFLNAIENFSSAIETEICGSDIYRVKAGKKD